MTTFAEEETEVYESLRRLEYVLNNRTESFTNKVESLIEVWKQVTQCHLTEHKQYVVHLMDWLKLHTLNIVLTGDWKKLKDAYEERLLKEVKHCEMLLLHSNNIFSLRCRKLAEVIKDPWGSPVLGRLLNSSEVEIGPEEIEFFGMETGYLISTRLRKLCESHCEDLALNLVTSFMRCHQIAEVQNFNLNATEDQKRFIMDVYIALLYKYKKTPLIISTLKSLTLKEGLELLKRFAHKRVNISKIWRHSSRIAHLAAQVYVTAAVMKSPKECSEVLEGLLDTWLFLNEGSDHWPTLTTAVRRIIQAADSAIHMYIFCDAFYKKFGSLMKTFIIELYIRALTTDVNDLERQKNEDNIDKVAETSERLAHGFLRLADVLNEHLKVSRECVLTAFTLKPTQAILDRIVHLAKDSGYEVLDTGQNWKCKLHPPIDSSDEVCYKCDECGEYMSVLDLKSPLNTNTALSEALTEEQLGLSPQLCDDLVVVLSSPRYQLFSWLVQWKDLHRLCVVYLHDPERTKNIVTELKFLDIDYSIFATVKREPEDEEVNGIERGYEHYLEDLYAEPCSGDDISPQEINLSSSDNSLPDNFHIPPLPVPKSDPKVLKSLRLFRPNLKRLKSNQADDRVPPKVFVSNTSTSPFVSGQPTLYVNYGPQRRVPNHASGFENYEDTYIPKTDPLRHTNPYIPNRSASNWHTFDASSSNHPYGQNLGFQNISNSNYLSKFAPSKTTKDGALNLSMKDAPSVPMDLSKYKVKRNWAQFKRLYVTRAINNFLKTKNAMSQNKHLKGADIEKVSNSQNYENKIWNGNSNLQNYSFDHKSTLGSSQDLEHTVEILPIEKGSIEQLSNANVFTPLSSRSNVATCTNFNISEEVPGDNTVVNNLLVLNNNISDDNNESDSQNFHKKCTNSDSPENKRKSIVSNMCIDECSMRAVPISSVDKETVIKKTHFQTSNNVSLSSEENELNCIPTPESISKNVIKPACSGADDKDHCSVTSSFTYSDGSVKVISPLVATINVSNHVLNESEEERDYYVPSDVVTFSEGDRIQELTSPVADTVNADSDSNYVPTDSEDSLSEDGGSVEVESSRVATNNRKMDERCSNSNHDSDSNYVPSEEENDDDVRSNVTSLSEDGGSVEVKSSRVATNNVEMEERSSSSNHDSDSNDEPAESEEENNDDDVPSNVTCLSEDRGSVKVESSRVATNNVEMEERCSSSNHDSDSNYLPTESEEENDDNVASNVSSLSEDRRGSVEVESSRVVTNNVEMEERCSSSNHDTDSNYVPTESEEENDDDVPSKVISLSEGRGSVKVESSRVPTNNVEMEERCSSSNHDSDSNYVTTESEEENDDDVSSLSEDGGSVEVESSRVATNNVEMDERCCSSNHDSDSNYVPTESEDENDDDVPSNVNSLSDDRGSVEVKSFRVATNNVEMKEKCSSSNHDSDSNYVPTESEEENDDNVPSNVNSLSEDRGSVEVELSRVATNKVKMEERCVSNNHDSDSNYVPTESEEENDDVPSNVTSLSEDETNLIPGSTFSEHRSSFPTLVEEGKATAVVAKENKMEDSVIACQDGAPVNFVEDSTLSANLSEEEIICTKTSMTKEVDRSNDENKIPNWCDFAFLTRNLTVRFSKRIEDLDNAIRRINVFEGDCHLKIDYKQVECDAFDEKKKIVKSRNINFRKNVDNKRKSIANTISRKLVDNYDLPTKKSKRTAKSKGEFKKADIFGDDDASKCVAKSASTSLIRKCTKVKDRDKNDLLDLVKKYKLKEARVVLHRLTWPSDYSDKKHGVKNYDRNILKQKTKPVAKKTLKKSENMNNTKSKGKGGLRKNKNELKPLPLQDISPKVNRYKDSKSDVLKKDKCSSDLKTDMNPCVVLKRLDFDNDKKRNANSVLAQVPGLNDLQMIRPSSVDRIVQVVQVPGSRTTTNVPIPNTQTSTQVTPHIQRIGQPRTEKPVNSETETTTSTTVGPSTGATSTTSDSPTLINILSQQIIRPANQNNCVNLKPRTSPLINILSQQIVKPATTVSNTKVTSSSGSTEAQVNNIPRVISGGDQIISQLINQVRAPTPTLKTLVSASGSDQNRILQFICKSSDGKLIPVTSFASNKVVKVSMTQTVNSADLSNSNSEENYTKIAQNACKTKADANEGLDTLPKFQQAFGKPAYNNVDSTESTTNTDEVINVDVDKSSNVKNQSKNSSASLNVQPVQGGVIYTRQVPVGQTINLIPPGRGQVFRIATSNPEQLSFVKDSVIQGKMSALLAAALHGKQRVTENNDTEVSTEDNSQTGTRVTLTARPPLVQNARIVKPVLQIPSNVIRSTPQSNLSSTTLEQLREFDMVYKQVKERSSTNAPTESSPRSDSNETTPQISVTYLNQTQKVNCAPVVVVSSYCNVQPAASPSLSVTSQGSSSPCVTPAPTLSLSSKTATKSPKSKSIKSTTTHTTKASPIPKPQQKPQEDEHTTQRIFDILAEYAEQLRNSPDLNNKPAPRRRSNPPTNPNQNAKRKKSSTSKKTGQSSNSLASDGDLDDTHTVGSEDSSCGVVQISVQDDEQPLPSVNTSESSEASVSPQQLILTDSAPNQSHSLIIADSNVGEALKMSNTAVLVPGNYIMPVSMVKGGQQIAVVSGGSKILATVPARSGPNMLLFQSFLNQTRKHGLPTVKYSAIQPISGIARNISGVPTQTTSSVPVTQNLTAVTLSPSVGLQKLNQFERVDVNNFDATEVFLAISQPQDNKTGIEQQSNHSNAQSASAGENVKSESSFDGEKSSVATSVIAQTNNVKGEISEEQSSTAATIMALNLNSSDNDKDATIKVEGRVQSVLVATGTSNGPMLSHNTPTYNKQLHTVNSVSEPNKDEYLRNEGKQNNSEPKNLPGSIIYPYQNKIKKNPVGSQRLDRELHQLSLQRKQAALERELRLQKSLSEECEDLGVDEPSASDLFPEADLLFDSNHSPSFDQTSQDLVKRVPVVQEVKEESRAIGIFCDDEPLRTDFLFEPIEYQPASVEMGYDRNRDVRNGQGNPQTNLSCEDNTLLRTCTSMSDVTIPSPISPEPYADLSPLTLTKRKYSYTNRKNIERVKQTENWTTELSSSEDTTGSAELVNSMSHSPEPFSRKRDQNLNCDEELYSFTILERLPLKSDQECQEINCEGVAECPSGRGARRSVKKTCSCCNGTVKVARKRPASRPPTPIKKTVTAKKR